VYVRAPLAVRVTNWFGHTPPEALEVFTTVSVGVPASTVTETTTLVVQPAVLVPTTVYEVLAVGETTIDSV
jgi:hypothetical protein